jgi:hypothetical protein
MRKALVATLLAVALTGPCTTRAADPDTATGPGGSAGTGAGPDKVQGLPNTSRSTPGPPKLGDHGEDPAHPATKGADSMTGDTRVPAGPTGPGH